MSMINKREKKNEEKRGDYTWWGCAVSSSYPPALCWPKRIEETTHGGGCAVSSPYFTDCPCPPALCWPKRRSREREEKEERIGEKENRKRRNAEKLRSDGFRPICPHPSVSQFPLAIVLP
jgi:hypothetical protein